MDEMNWAVSLNVCTYCATTMSRETEIAGPSNLNLTAVRFNGSFPSPIN